MKKKWFDIPKYDWWILGLMCANIIYMHAFKTPWIPVMRLYDIYLPISHLLFDVSAVWFIAYLLSIGNRKAQYVIGFFSTWMWTIINVVYSRFFGQYFSFSVLGEIGDNLNGLWWLGYVGQAFRISDVLLILFLVAFVCILRKVQKKHASIFLSVLLPILVVSIYFGIVNPVMSCVKSKGKNIVFVDDQDTVSDSFLTFWLMNPDRQILQYGIFRTQVYFALFPLQDIELSEDQKNSIESYCANSPALSSGDCHNIRKNITFILVESYLSCTSDLIVGDFEITPNLNKLKHKEGAYFNGNIVQNTSAGESSDGQLIYWTGLFPLSGEISIPHIVKNKIDCFPQLMKEVYNYETTMVLPTLANFWRQDELNRVYGIDTIYTAIQADSPITNYFGNDEIVIDSLMNVRHNGNGPFLDIAVTMSMHAPYEDSCDLSTFKKISFPEDYTKEYCNYLTWCHYMDGQIGRYIDFLEKQNLLDNTIIIVASDHQAHETYLKMPSDKVNDYHLPFYIIGGEMNLENSYYGTANQIDIFTTLLDLFSVESEWKGLGRSLLNAETYEDVNTEKVKEISNLIIRSNWFEKK